MLFKECIKKYNSSTYISLYNKDNQRFYGAFVDDPSLADYLDYEVEYDMEKGNFIRLIKLCNYEHPLGLNSMKIYWEKKQRINSSKGR